MKAPPTPISSWAVVLRALYDDDADGTCVAVTVVIAEITGDIFSDGDEEGEKELDDES